jgi:uncharacterized protein DUF4114
MRTIVTALAGVLLQSLSAMADPALDTLPRLPICTAPDGSPVLRCSTLTLLPNAETFRVLGEGPVDVPITFTFNESTLAGALGVVAVDAASGAIDGIAPGRPGYRDAALRHGVIVRAAGETAPTTTVTLTGGSRVIFFLVTAFFPEDATIERALLGGADGPSVYFSIARANEGGLDHLVAFTDANSRTQLAFEDVRLASDLDYDDLVVTLGTALSRPSSRAARRTCVRDDRFTPAVATCMAETGQPARACRRDLLRTCLRFGPGALGGVTTTTTTSTTTTTTLPWPLGSYTFTGTAVKTGVGICSEGAVTMQLTITALADSPTYPPFMYVAAATIDGRPAVGIMPDYRSVSLWAYDGSATCRGRCYFYQSRISFSHVLGGAPTWTELETINYLDPTPSTPNTRCDSTATGTLTRN